MERASLIDRAVNAERSAWRLCAESVAVMHQAHVLLFERRRVGWAMSSTDRQAPSAVRRTAFLATEDLGYDFEIRGTVSGHPVSATLGGDGLRCDPLLRAHAELVVALGETFPYGDDGALPAALDGNPAQILLTLMRAMKVTRLELCLEPQCSGPGFCRTGG
jgi:hypothetical protein